jgi:hypothetical protein
LLPTSFHPLHKPSFLTIDIEREDRTIKQQGKGEPDLAEDQLLPPKGKRGSPARAAALLSGPNNMDAYLQAISKLNFSFHTSMSKYSQRYREQREQDTVFSKTI